MTQPAGRPGPETFEIPATRPAIFRSCPNLVAAFSPRAGGRSAPPFDSLNLGGAVGDSPHAVQENRRRFFAALGLADDRIAYAEQVHGSDVRICAEPGRAPACDGLVTNRPGLTLAIKVADCAVVLLADPDVPCIGAFHAGWRGAIGGITGRAMHALLSVDADPGRLLVYVSPCISVDRFEVGPEVASRFPAEYVKQRPEWRREHVDLRGFLRDQLRAEGVRDDHIEVDSRCTVSSPEQFFSHRASNGRTGRHLGIISILPSPPVHVRPTLGRDPG